MGPHCLEGAVGLLGGLQRGKGARGRGDLGAVVRGRCLAARMEAQYRGARNDVGDQAVRLWQAEGEGVMAWGRGKLPVALQQSTRALPSPCPVSLRGPWVPSPRLPGQS